MYRLSCSYKSETDGGEVSGAGEASTKNGLSLLNDEKITVAKVIWYSEAWNFYAGYKLGNKSNGNLAYSLSTS